MENFYWEQVAQKNNRIKTSPDIGCDILEREFIKKYLSTKSRVLDIGSGDGLATIDFARKSQEVHALEPSRTLLKIAKKHQQHSKINNIAWHQGSIKEIKKIFPKSHFNVLISKRVLINILSWPEQKQAIDEIASLMRKNDLFLLVEGFEDTFASLQKIRKKFGLAEDKVVKFNHYFIRKQFEEYIQKYFRIIEQNNFGLYYFLSHFFYPLLIKPNEPKYSAKINRIAVKVALKEKLLEEFGYINFYALKRK